MEREVLLIVALAGLAGASWSLQESEVAPADGETKQDRLRLLELPDTTFVDTLNDTVDAPPLKHYWGPIPWSPITGVERSSTGVDWYRHANGSYSTTQMVWRSDLGRLAAMTRVAHPGPQPPAVAVK